MQTVGEEKAVQPGGTEASLDDIAGRKRLQSLFASRQPPPKDDMRLRPPTAWRQRPEIRRGLVDGRRSGALLPEVDALNLAEAWDPSLAELVPA